MEKDIILLMERLRIDFHCHSIYSKDSLSKPADLVATAKKRGLTRLVISDHNNIHGAIQAKKIDPELIIVGEEIMTSQGEILASFVQEEIPKGLPPMQVISLLRDQGAFISISHPFDTHRNGSWVKEEMIELLPLIDAIEGFNSRCINSGFNGLAMEFAKQHNMAVTVGSDAHTLGEVGQAFLEVDPFDSAQGLRQVIRQGKLHNRLSSPAVHLASRWAVLVKKMGGGQP